MALFKDTSDFASEYPLLENSDWGRLLPFVELNEARTIANQVLGNALYDLLHSAYQASIATSPTALPSRFDSLLPKVRKTLAFFVVYDALPTLNVQLSASGAHVVATAQQQPAPMWRVNQMRDQVLEQAHGFLDLLLLHLTGNESTYPEWVTSPYRTEVRESFVQESRHIERHVRIDSPWLLHQLRPSMRELQNGPIKSLLGDTAYAAMLAAIVNNTLSSQQKQQLELIRPAMIHHAIAEMCGPLQLKMNNRGVWNWQMTSSGGGSVSGGEQSATTERLVGLQRHHSNKSLKFLKELSDLLNPATPTTNDIPGRTGSVFGSFGAV